DLRRVNKKTVESLIKAGVFAAFANHATLLFHYPRLVKEIAEAKEDGISGQFGLFSDTQSKKKLEDNFTLIEEFGEDELYNMEKEVIGFLITKNPLTKYENIIKEKTSSKVGDISKEDIGKVHVLVGIISSKKII